MYSVRMQGMPDKKIQQELKNIGKKIAACGFIIGEGGNISARTGSVIYIKRRGASMDRAKADDYIPIDLKTGKPLRKKDRPSTEIYMHLACYRSRKDVGAVVHTHPAFATVLGIADVSVKPFSYEMAVNLKSHIAKINYVQVGTSRLGQAVGRTIRRHNAILLKNHGLVTVGKDLKEAFLRTLAVERAALIYTCCKILDKVTFLKKTDYKRFFEPRSNK